VIADVGLTAGVLREISSHPDRTERVMQAFVPLSALVSAMTVGVLLGVGFVAPFTADTKTAIAIGSIGAFLTLMTLALSPVLQARLQMHWVVLGVLAGRAVTLGLLSAAGGGLGLTAAITAWVIGLAVTFGIQAAVVMRQVSLRPSFDVSYCRELVGSSVLLGVANALGQINFRVDTIILAWFRSTATVGYYGAAYKFVELAQSTGGAVGISVFPAFARFATARDRRLGELAQRALEVTAAAAAGASVLMACFPAQIIGWTAGDRFVPGTTALRILAAFVPFGLLTSVLWRLLMAVREDRSLTRIAAGTLSLAVALNLALIPPFGMNAAALVTVSTEIVVAAACTRVLVRRHDLAFSLRYARVLAIAVGAAVAVALALPGPKIVVFLATLVTYTAILLVAPGTVRDTATGLLRALRPSAGSG
jgi:O-antigen/teichoic acid export membrane protein